MYAYDYPLGVRELADLETQGVLTDTGFEAQMAKVLAGS
jgi:hypothetical protein